MADPSFKILVATPERIIFEGNAKSVILPGERGVFEVLPYHKRILSRLVRGMLNMDGSELKIKRGVAKVGLNEVTVIVEEDL
jgi:F-type H+-transporting ATPase subunit epsilon